MSLPGAEHPPAGEPRGVNEGAGQRYFGTDTTVFDAARLDAMAGQPVFPVHPLTKAPLVRNGFKDATTDLEVVRKWWQRWPDANVAAPVPDGVFILDIDRRKGGDRTIAKLTKFFGTLPATRTVVTGDGCHLYFVRFPGELAVPRQCKGIDLRDAGKHYTVRPPSVHSCGERYKWLGDANDAIAEPPAWLAELVRRPEVRTAPVPSSPAGTVSAPATPSAAGTRPGDAFNARHTCDDVLVGAGWQLVKAGTARSDYVRPGKAARDGHSASVFADTGGCTVYSSTVEVERVGQGQYDAFGLYAALHHGDDRGAAALDLSRRGYGDG